MDERITAYLGGDQRAGEQLLLELLPRIRNVVRSLLGRDAEVDDVAQQVMVELIRSLASFRGDSPLVGWVDRITVRVALAHARKARGRSRTEQPFDESHGLEVRPTLVDVSSASGERYVLKRRAVALLDALPAAQKTAVLLHHVLGLSIAEVASHEQTAPETIRSRIRVGIGKLRQWSEAEHPNGEKRGAG